MAEDRAVQSGGVSDQRVPLEFLRSVGRERGDQRRRDAGVPGAVPAGGVVDFQDGVQVEGVRAVLV